MKALVKAKSEPGIWMEDVPVPVYGPNDVLVKIHKTAICGTDIHIYNWDDWAEATVPVPMVIGHEFFGEILELGKEVKTLKVGQRVSGEGHVICGTCRNCRAGRQHLCRTTLGIGVNRQGCFAEYLAIPASNVLSLPDNITADQAAILDPLGNATHCALSFNLIGEDVLITGAGPIGIMAVAIAKHAGARHVVITDINDYRLDLARKTGATRAINIKHDTLDDTMNRNAKHGEEGWLKFRYKHTQMRIDCRNGSVAYVIPRSGGLQGDSCMANMFQESYDELVAKWNSGPRKNLGCPDAHGQRTRNSYQSSSLQNDFRRRPG